MNRRHFMRIVSATGLTAATGAPLLRARAFAAPPVPSERRRVEGPTFETIPASASGIAWIHANAMSPNRYLPETMGPGVAFFDSDNDGWVDIFMVNSGAADFYQPKTPLKNALYKNNRDGTFTDVTDKAGVAGGAQFGMGCAVGDYDNDGHQASLVTAYGSCTPYKNNGNGTFTHLTAKAGAGAPGWTTSAAGLQQDNDGRLGPT